MEQPKVGGDGSPPTGADPLAAEVLQPCREDVAVLRSVQSLFGFNMPIDVTAFFPKGGLFNRNTIARVIGVAIIIGIAIYKHYSGRQENAGRRIL